ncbi:hypothetical protein DMUE_3846 [Dictyocoela muelleri]|nr:hypothetical protein DMUE_3846 [Dictyocoela muelleri]
MKEKDQKQNVTEVGVLKKINEDFLENIHILLVHPGLSKLYYTIKPYIVSPNLKKSIKEICSKCLSCENNKRRYNKYGLYGNPIISYKVFDYISSDILGPIEKNILKIHIKGTTSIS